MGAVSSHGDVIAKRLIAIKEVIGGQKQEVDSESLDAISPFALVRLNEGRFVFVATKEDVISSHPLC